MFVFSLFIILASVRPAIDTELTPELEAEGYARDVVRAVQDERKNAGLHIADRIDLSLTVPSDHVADVETWRDMIAAETLALSLRGYLGRKRAISCLSLSSPGSA